MTIAAHNGRRVWGGASLARNVEAGTAQRASMFYELNPHLRKKEKAALESVAEKIRPWLEEHGPATAQQVAKGIGTTANAVNANLRRGVAGVVEVGTLATTRNHKSKVWGVA